MTSETIHIVTCKVLDTLTSYFHENSFQCFKDYLMTKLTLEWNNMLHQCHKNLFPSSWNLGSKLGQHLRNPSWGQSSFTIALFHFGWSFHQILSSVWKLYPLARFIVNEYIGSHPYLRFFNINKISVLQGVKLLKVKNIWRNL
jgi:hypothetical protein